MTLARRLTPGLPIVELAGVAFSRGGQQILKSIDLTVRCGERIVLIGPSGSGKSTILRCINGLSRPDKGTVKLFDTEMETTDAWHEARLHMDTIFQSFNLYTQMRVLDNVMLAPQRLLGRPQDEARTIAERHLAALGVGHLAPRYPHELSGGQAQRVALARALAKEPDILLLDEPTSALDPENVKGALEAITAATEKGITTISVTHELGFARRQAHRVLFIDEGRIVETGTPEEIFTAPRSERLKRFLDALN